MHRSKDRFLAKEAFAAKEYKRVDWKVLKGFVLMLGGTGLLMFLAGHRSPSGVALRLRMMKENELFRSKMQLVTGLTLVTLGGMIYLLNDMAHQPNPYSEGLIGKY